MSDVAINRIQQLLEDGERDQATRFVRGIRYGSSVASISVKDSVVVVETDRFIGKHDLVKDWNGEETFEEGGTYRLKSDRVEFSFTVTTLDEETIDEIEEALHHESQGEGPETGISGTGQGAESSSVFPSIF